MRYFLGVFILVFVTSCSYFDKKKISEQEILDEELKTINWNDVDTYPLFEDCENTASKEAGKNCFESKLTSVALGTLQSANYVVSRTINDTIFLSFQIDQEGTLDIKDISISDQVIFEMPKIDSILRIGLKNIPRILPAIKRGQPVRTEFKLPIVISSN